MAPERLFELRRRTFDTPHFRGIEFIETEAKTILNKVPGNYLPFNWTINAYRGCSHMCRYCFSRPTHTYLGMNASTDFDTKIVVKVNAPELLRKELRAKRWKGESVAMGTNTDPYQRAEGKYRLTRRLLETLTEVRNPFSVLTKGTLILRDLDVLTEAAQLTEVSTAFSIPTLDEEVWSRSEPGTPHPRKRIEAVAKLNDAGVPCGVLVAPLLPGLSDSKEQIRAVVEAALDAGATFVSPILLHLRPIVKDVYLDWLSENYPDLMPLYEEMYARSAYARPSDKKALSARFGEVLNETGRPKPRPRRRRPSPTEIKQEIAKLETKQMQLL